MILRDKGPILAASGSLLVLIRNVLLLSGVIVLVVGKLPAGGYLISLSLYLDLVGVFLIGFGLLSLTLKDSTRQPQGARPFWSPARLGLLSGVLCLAWFFLTV